MDVKVGTGAFMDSHERAVELANSIIATANTAGLKTRALITDMNEVLGTTAGNALEIAESMRYLRNEEREPRLDDITLALCAEMVLIGGLEDNREAARLRCEDAVSSGRAAEIFGRMTAALGGPSDFVERPIRRSSGYGTGNSCRTRGGCRTRVQVNTRAVGNAIIELGGGRRKVGEQLDLAVGFSNIASIGTAVDSEQKPLAVIHAASEDDADRAAKNILSACKLGDSAPGERPTIAEILTAE